MNLGKLHRKWTAVIEIFVLFSLLYNQNVYEVVHTIEQLFCTFPAMPAGFCGIRECSTRQRTVTVIFELSSLLYHWKVYEVIQRIEPCFMCICG